MARAAEIAPAQFFAGVRKEVKARLPEPLRRFEVGRGHSRLLKLHHTRPDVHFEAWHHTGDGRLEIGLHFEGSRDFNERAFAYFRARMVEVKALLPRAELEPWDRGWSRLYETIPAPHLDERVQSAAVERMTAYITVLQPMVLDFLG
ncbi:MAG TPA: hypothetical protein VKT20_09430 [Candidatus Dormibacteraeota bacterium]|nr:hypothetical protein [Candidatus Dormibacteraeota bacterium]